MFSLRKINDKHVKAIPIPDEDKRPIKGYDICEEVYANIYLCSRKKSGKTCALFKILKECAGKKTKIVVFCSTSYKDKNWIQIRKYFANKGMDIEVFTSIYEDGVDQLSNLVEELKKEAKAENDRKEGKGETQEEEEEEEEIERCDDILQRLQQMHLYATGQASREEEINEEESPRKQSAKKSKYQSPEYIIVFDDLSSELKSRSLLSLLKFNRHFKSKLIISSQWLHDLLPESRKQIDLFLIFKGFPEKKLQEIYKDCDSGVPFELFYKIYKKSTKYPHSFMYIDTRSDSFRRNFNEQFILDHEEI